MLRFSIIIVSWNALHHLKTFLPSVAQSRYDNLEIILADNASTDDSVHWVKQHFPEVKTVSFDQNYGYCGGNNRAVPYATGDILIFLNNDVKVDTDWINPLARLFESSPNIGVAQPKIRSYQNPKKFEYAGAAGGYIDRYGFPFCRGRIFDSIENDHGQYNDQREIFWASGAAFAIRRDLYEQAGGFDEDFEFHMEEIDLCWRLWNRGKRVVYCPESTVYHLGGGSLPMHSSRKLYYNYRNSLVMLIKNYAASNLIYLIPRMAMDLLALMRELLNGHVENAKAIFKAYMDFFEQLPKTTKKRSSTQKDKTSSDAPIKSFSIVWRYFIKHKKHFNEL